MYIANKNCFYFLELGGENDEIDIIYSWMVYFWILTKNKEQPDKQIDPAFKKHFKAGS